MDKLLLLLSKLQGQGATDEAMKLSARIAAATSLENPYRVSERLKALQAAGATEQVAALLDRDPASHVSLMTDTSSISCCRR